MTFDRRDFIAGAAAAAITATTMDEAFAATPATVTLPMENGTRPLVAFPQKRPLLMLSPRPPLLETPFSVFDDGVLTPNDAFYVRWHLSGIPTTVDGDAHRINVHGLVKRPLSLSVADLRTRFKPVEIVAVNQCSGNSRGLFSPRVPGGQWDNGAMGNARWTGVRLTDVLARAGLDQSVRQVRFHGLEHPALSTTPPFVKALQLDDIFDKGDIMIAYEMNGAAAAAAERLSRSFGRAGLVCDVLDENAQRHRGDRYGRRQFLDEDGLPNSRNSGQHGNPDPNGVQDGSDQQDGGSLVRDQRARRRHPACKHADDPRDRIRRRQRDQVSAVIHRRWSDVAQCRSRSRLRPLLVPALGSALRRQAREDVYARLSRDCQ